MCSSIHSYHLDLCERIRAHCQQQHWFGPSGDKTSDPHAPEMYDADGTWHPADWSFFGYRGYIDEYGQIQERKITHDLRVGFEFPPATEAQVLATETALGIPLPPMLRALYTTVANGGFGPATGFTGIQGGYIFGGDGHYHTLDQENEDEPSVEYVDLATFAQEQRNPLRLEWDSSRRLWFKHFWPICYNGCGEDYCLDAKSGHIYLVGAGANEHHETRIYLIYMYSSLEEWLELWLEYDK
jgi:hypothetical protein